MSVNPRNRLQEPVGRRIAQLCVSLALLRPIGQMEAGLVLLGGGLDSRCPGQSQRFVETECLRNIRLTDFRNTRREHGAVFDGLCSALRPERQHCVASIAEQGYASGGPM